MDRFPQLRTLAVVLLLSLLTVPFGANAAPGGGNGANAHLCQQGGWQDLTRTDGTPFKNQGDCISYAAQGGTVVTMPSPAISATSSPGPINANFGPTWLVTVSGTGFTPGGAVTIVSKAGTAPAIITITDPAKADANGAIGPGPINEDRAIPCTIRGVPLLQVTITATDETSGLQASTTVRTACT